MDLGCHSGLLTSKLANHLSAKVWGLDISEMAIEYAKKQHPHLNFLACDLSKGIPFSDQEFDIVTAFDVLEHIPRVEFVVKEAKRVLKDGGFFVLASATDSPIYKVVWFFWTKGRGKVWQDVHDKNFSLKELKNLLQEQKFKVLNKKSLHLGMYKIIKYQKEG